MKTPAIKKFVVFLSCVLPLVLTAANLTWDADTVTTGVQDGSGSWDTSTANWWTGSADTTFNIATPDAPTFGALGGAGGTVTLGVPIVSGSIIFNAPSVGNYTIAGGGNTLSLTNMTVTANVDATISADITGGSVTLGNSGANAPSGVLTLSGNNSYAGGFSLGANAPNTTSAVRVNSSTAFGTGTISHNSQGNQNSGRVEILGGINITNAISFQGRNNPTAGFVAISGANTLSGTITGAAGGQNYRFESEAANGLTLAGGLVLQTSGTRNYVLGGSGGGTFSGVISGGASTITIVKAGGGTWALSGANTYSGNATVGAGTLTLDYSSQNNSKLPDAGVLTLAGGTLNLSGGTHTEVIGSTTIAPGSSSVARSSGSSTISIGAITRSVGGVVDFGTAGIASTATANVNGILGGYATVAGADWAVGGGSVAAYTGYTDIAASGSSIADGATSNVRLNSAGGGGNIALGAATTTINTLLQNTSTAATVDTSAGTLRLGATGGVLVPSGMQGITFGTSAGSGTLSAGGADNTAGEIILINNSANNISVNSVVADNGSGVVSLTKSGSGTATLAGANTYSGATTVAGGTLNVSADNNLGTAPGSATPNTIVLNGGVLNATATFALNPNRGMFLGSLNANGYNGGTISVASGQALTNNAIIAGGTVNGSAGFTATVGPGSLTKTGDGTLVLGGANTYAGGTFINGGTISISSSGNLGTQPSCYIPDHLVLNGGTLEATTNLTLGGIRGIMLGAVGGSGGGTFQVDSGVALQLDSRIADNWNGSGSLTKTGPGTLILTSGFNDYSGDTTVSDGMLQLANPRAVPNGSDKGNVIINSPGALGVVTNLALKSLSGNGTVDNPSNNPVSLTLGFYNTSSTFNGVIQNSGGGPLTLVKTGNGTLTLGGGANTYSGSTLINNGILALGASSTIANSTNIFLGTGSTLDATGLGGGLTLAAGQQLSGSGTVLGNVTDPASSIAPGGAGTAGTLTFANNLTLSGNGALNYDLATATTPGGGVNDLIVVNGTLNLAGQTTLTLNYLGGLPGVGTYTLFQYNTLAGSVTNLIVPLGLQITNDATAKTIGLLVTHPPTPLTWAGDGVGNVWDMGTTPNWKHSGTNVSFFVGDTATFDDSGSAAPPINIVGPVFPTAVIVNTTQNYDFTNGAIATGSLTKSGSGTLILEGNNSYSGPTTINGGTLQVGNNNGVGTPGAGLITNNASLVFNRTNTITVSTNISGSGAVTQNGSGDLDLAANITNTFAGTMTVNNGRVLARNTQSLGNGSTVVGASGQIYLLSSGNLPPNPMTLSGSGSDGSGALRKGGGTTTSFGGTITLESDTTLNVDGNGAVLNLTNASGIDGASVNANLTLTGSGAGNITGPLSLGTGNLTVGGGTWTVAPSNSFSGLTTINGGALLITAPASLGPVPAAFNAGQVTLNGGALGAAANVTLDDGNIGITVSDVSTASGIAVNNTNATFIISNNITGSSSTALTKTGPGTLVLIGPNTYAGTLNIDGNDTANDGTTVIANNQAIANLLAVPTVPYIFIRNNNAGSSTLALDGSQGSITVAPDISLAGRNNTVPAIENLAGSNTISGNITMVVGGGNYEIQSDSGTLALTAPLPLATPISLPVRTNTFLGAGNIIAFGVIQDYSLGGTNVSIMVVKQGTGILTLPAANTYTGPTVVTNGVLSLPSPGSISTNTVTVSGSGLLVGNGTIAGPVTVQSGGSIETGSTNTIGMLNLSGPLTLSGNTIVKINKTAGTHDLFSGQSSVNYGGTLTVTNLAGTLTTSDSFALFSPGASASNFASIVGSPGPGLAYSFTNGVLSVVTGVVNPEPITPHLSGSTLTLTWPSTGWTLQSQTNALGKGLSTNWVDVAGSSSSNTNVSTINPTNPAVFYRLRH